VNKEISTAGLISVFLSLSCMDPGLHRLITAPEGIAALDSGLSPSLQTETPPPDLTAGLHGRVCDPSGSYWVAGATVSLARDEDQDGTADIQRHVETNGDGHFHLLGLPPGPARIDIRKGSFSTHIDVELINGEITHIKEPSCLSRDNIDIAVVEGKYDDIGEILDFLTLPFESYEGANSTQYLELLGDPAEMAKYDIIFLNCGIEWSWVSQQEEIRQNIVDYVEHGGSLYASDWAYWFIEQSFPEFIDFSGDDHHPGQALHGAPGGSAVSVLDPNMQTLLGSSSAQIYFNYNSWATIEAAGETGTVLVEGDMSLEDGSLIRDSPLTVRLNGNQRVIYTAFHNEAQTTLDMELLLLEIILSL
jgi:SAM-dependent methyltransferase